MSQAQTVDDVAVDIDRVKAKALILEILHQSGKPVGRALLYKIFWLAHLYYTQIARGFMSAWPIMRVHSGPGIDKGDVLLRELVDSGAIRQELAVRGPFTEVLYHLTDMPADAELGEKDVEAIRLAVEFVEAQGARGISDLFHGFSRSWSSTPDGEELNIYVDLTPDGEYEEMQRQAKLWKKAYEELFK